MPNYNLDALLADKPTVTYRQKKYPIRRLTMGENLTLLRDNQERVEAIMAQPAQAAEDGVKPWTPEEIAEKLVEERARHDFDTIKKAIPDFPLEKPPEIDDLFYEQYWAMTGMILEVTYGEMPPNPTDEQRQEAMKKILAKTRVPRG